MPASPLLSSQSSHRDQTRDHSSTSRTSTKSWAEIQPMLMEYPCVLNYLEAQPIADDTMFDPTYLSNTIQHRIIHQSPVDVKTFHTLLDELASLKLHDAVLCCIDHHPRHKENFGFNELLFEGATAMVCGQLKRAELSLKHAHHLMPTETAPVINLAKIFLDSTQWHKAKLWIEAGLTAHPNNLKFWNLWVDYLYEQTPTHAIDLTQLRAKAAKLHSWQGVSIVGKLHINQQLQQAGADPYHDIDINRNSHHHEIYLSGVRQVLHDLAVFYHEGERELEFLIEYTALLGAAGQYKKIPPIVWEARHSTDGLLPWQLEHHAIHSALALDQFDTARQLISQFLTDQAHTAPTEHLQALSHQLKNLAAN